jgi:hypothetical protein
VPFGTARADIALRSRRPDKTMALPERLPRAASAGSGTHSMGIGRLRAVMQRYISTILVDSVLERAVNAHPGAMDLHAITEDCMIGLRLFVDERRLPELMVELAGVLEELDGR